MTKENKDLIFKELCSRLPYGVKAEKYTIRMDGEIVPHANIETVNVKDLIAQKDCPGYIIKPYLLPLSSMTEEQKKECNFADDLDSDILDAALCTNHYNRTGIPTVTYNLVDWCIKNNFDYRGLIPMGLAKDATNLNIY